MTTWTCRYCTFENGNVVATICGMCGNPGKRSALQENLGNDSQNAIDLTGTISETTNDTTKPSAAKRPSTSAYASTVPTTNTTGVSRKRKVPPTSNNSDSDARIHPFFSNKAEQRAKCKEMLRAAIDSAAAAKSKVQPKTMALSSPYPHSFSLTLVPKRSPQDAKQAVRNALDFIFHLEDLRNLQPQAVHCALRLESQMIVMATGGGKSLCYQLPACLLGGVTIVISPLLALMKDQTEALNAKGIPAACINSSQTEKQNKEILERVVPSLFPKGDAKTKKAGRKDDKPNVPTPVLLYITPESIQSDRMRTVLKRLYEENRLALFAVDEAHCLSSWGHDFRPAYRRLNILRTNFPKTPCMALTATATPNVISDIRNELSLQGCPLHIGSFDRPNIFYKIKFKDALDNPIQDLVKTIIKTHKTCKSNGAPCSGIVYVHKREETSMIASAISKAGILASGYHAGLKKDERLAVQEGWSNGAIQVAVATVAFGMGIDKDCVRYVIHWCIPKTIEGFYQESGRAGRDGLPSHSILYYSADDVGKFRYLIRMQSSNKKGNEKGEDQNLERKLSHLEEMEKYCTELKCRRNTLIGHFGGKTVDCRRTCDFCIDPKKVETALRSAKATKDTRNQNRGGGHKQPWDGQWDGPHGESSAFANEWRNDGLMVGDLRVTGPLEVDPGIPESNTTSSGSGVSFVKASDILSKYEAMEGRAHRYGGFGDSEPGSNAKSSSVNIPDHLIASLNAASTNAMKEKSRETKSQKILTSQDHAKSVDEIEKQLAKIKAEREARLKALLEKQGGKTARPPPPPPPLSFGRKK